MVMRPDENTRGEHRGLSMRLKTIVVGVLPRALTGARNDN